MAFSNAGGSPSGPQINITPLIDVLLTLIVVFMVVVSMDKEQEKRHRFHNRIKSKLRAFPSRAPLSFRDCGQKTASRPR
jgi:hypothetical protein